MIIATGIALMKCNPIKIGIGGVSHYLYVIKGDMNIFRSAKSSTQVLYILLL